MTKRETRTAAFLDLKPDAEKATSHQLAYSDAPLTGEVIGLVDDAHGLVEVQIDGSEGSVIAPADAGLTYIGARVSMPRDSSGRVTGVRAPSGETPEGVDVIAVGETGRMTVDAAARSREAEAEAAAARAEAERATTRMATLDGDITQTRRDVEANHQEITGRLAASEERITSAQAKADQAARDLAAEKTRVSDAVSRLGTVEASAASLSSRLEAAQVETAAAKAAASQAHAVASQAQKTADAATSKASQLEATASQASSKADAAQASAEQAKKDAAAAAGLADGKSTVVIQASAPAASLRVASTLWIDTTGGANTPKRWNGTGWVAVSDKAALDAASKAAQAQATASQAKTEAAQAQATAAAATTAAAKAQSTADQSTNLAKAAQSRADEGVSLATAAQTQASGATTAAGKAQATADAAKASAAATDAKALAAQADAAKAQTVADAALAASPDLAAGAWTREWSNDTEGRKTIVSAGGAVWPASWKGSAGIILLRKLPVVERTLRLSATVVNESSVPSRMVLRLHYLNSAGKWVAYNQSPVVSAPVGEKTISLDIPMQPGENRVHARVALVSLDHVGPLRVVSAPTLVDVTEVLALQARADKGVEDAARAQQKADEAAAKALGAQATADQANSRMATIDGKVTVAYKAPTVADGAGKAKDAVWWTLNGTSLESMWVWTGSAWKQHKAGINFVGENSIGVAQIAEGILGKFTAAHGQLNDANIGALNVSKLVVTGGASFPEAVMRVLLADQAFLKAVVAQTVLVAGDNRVFDPLFSRDEVWNVNSGYTMWDSSIVYPGASRSQKFVQRPVGSSNMSIYSRMHPREFLTRVTPGERIIARCWWKTDGVFPDGGGFACRVYFYTPDYKHGSGENVPAGAQVKPADAPLNTWFETGGQVAVPDWAAYAQIRPSLYQNAGVTPNAARAWLGKVEIRSAVGSTLIEPGSITTPHLATNSVDARVVNGKEVAGAIGRFMQITTDQIKAGQAKIAGELIATNIAGKTITGSTVTSGTKTDFVTMGAGIVQAITGGVETARVDPAGGVSVRNPLTKKLASVSDLVFGAVHGISQKAVYYTVADKSQWYGPWSEQQVLKFRALTTRVVILSQIGIPDYAATSKTPGGTGLCFGGLSICQVGTSNYKYSNTYKSGDTLQSAKTSVEAWNTPVIVGELDISVFDGLTVGAQYQVSVWYRFGNPYFGDQLQFLEVNKAIYRYPSSSLVMPI